MVVLILNLAAPDVPEFQAQAPRPRAPEVLAALEEQSRLLAELLEPYSDPTGEPPKPSTPQRRGAGPSDTAAA